MLPRTEVTDPKTLHVGGFHFHREGHDGYSQYPGQFPGGVVFDDTESDVTRKLGPPLSVGGGGFSSLLNKAVKPIFAEIRACRGTIAAFPKLFM